MFIEGNRLLVGKGGSHEYSAWELLCLESVMHLGRHRQPNLGVFFRRYSGYISLLMQSLEDRSIAMPSRTISAREYENTACSDVKNTTSKMR